MVEPIAADECVYIAGNGEYDIEVVGVPAFQETLEWLARGRGETPTDYDCRAVLVPELDNPDDPDAVAVTILGQLVGYLPADAADRMSIAMDKWDFNYATCEAVIGGGWYRSRDDKGDFQVWLDVNPDFEPESLPCAGDAIEPLAPAAPEPIDGPVAKSGFPLRGILIGAAATVAIVVLFSFVWLGLPASSPSTSNEILSTALATPLLAEAPPTAIQAATVRTITPAAIDLPSAAHPPRVLPKVVTPVAAPLESRAALAASEARADRVSPGTVAPASATARMLELIAVATVQPLMARAAPVVSPPPTMRAASEYELNRQIQPGATVPQTDPPPVAPPVAAVLPTAAKAPVATPPPVTPARPSSAASSVASASPTNPAKPATVAAPTRSHMSQAAPRATRSRVGASRYRHANRWQRRAVVQERERERERGHEHRREPAHATPAAPRAAQQLRPELRPGETMASRMFQDGLNEWYGRGLPSMLGRQPRPAN